MILAFDLDGTLIDTRMAVVAAYKLAGVDMPNEAWGRAWPEWLSQLVGAEAESIHQLKNQHYPRMLQRYAQELPLFHLALRLQSPVLTGASPAAVRCVRNRFTGLNIVGMGMTLAEKIAWLNAHEPGHYVDDSKLARLEVAKNTSWTPLTPEEAMSLTLVS